jgi:hypothetical protein
MELIPSKTPFRFAGPLESALECVIFFKWQEEISVALNRALTPALHAAKDGLDA